MKKFLLIREAMDKINTNGSINVKIVEASKFDTTGYSFLRNMPDTVFEEWVPTEELETYRRTLRM